jgi:hypothetical protein
MTNSSLYSLGIKSLAPTLKRQLSNYPLNPPVLNLGTELSNGIEFHQFLDQRQFID